MAPAAEILLAVQVEKILARRSDLAPAATSRCAFFSLFGNKSRNGVLRPIEPGIRLHPRTPCAACGRVLPPPISIGHIRPIFEITFFCHSGFST